MLKSNKIELAICQGLCLFFYSITIFIERAQGNAAITFVKQL